MRCYASENSSKTCLRKYVCVRTRTYVRTYYEDDDDDDYHE